MPENLCSTISHSPVWNLHISNSLKAKRYLIFYNVRQERHIHSHAGQAGGGTNRERVGNVNRNASTRLSGRDKNTQKHVYTYTHKSYITLLQVSEGSEKQGWRGKKKVCKKVRESGRNRAWGKPALCNIKTAEAAGKYSTCMGTEVEDVLL